MHAIQTHMLILCLPWNCLKKNARGGKLLVCDVTVQAVYWGNSYNKWLMFCESVVRIYVFPSFFCLTLIIMLHFALYAEIKPHLSVVQVILRITRDR